MFCNAVCYVTFTFWKLNVLELLRGVQLRLVTLRQVTFTLCCFTLCSNIVSGRQTSTEVVYSLTHTQLHSHPNISPLLQLLPGDRQRHILIIWEVLGGSPCSHTSVRGSGPCMSLVSAIAIKIIRCFLFTLDTFTMIIVPTLWKIVIFDVYICTYIRHK